MFKFFLLPKHKQLSIAIFLLVFFFSLIWASIMPIGGEGPDEPQHLAVIQGLVSSHRIPIFNENSDAITFNPGLLSGAYYPMTYNSPFNYVFYLPIALVKGLNSGAKAVLNYRFISSLLLALFSLFVFLSLNKIKPDNLSVAAVSTLFISLIPQVIFSGSYINIEPVALFFSAVSFYLLINYIDRKSNYHSALILGTSLGLLALCKVNFLIWLVVVLVIAIYKTLKSNMTMKSKIINITLIILPIILINLYWWLRNYQLYHDPIIVNYITNQIKVSAPDWFSPPSASGYNIFSILFEKNFVRFTYLGFFAGLGGAFIFLPMGIYYLFYLFLFVPVCCALYIAFYRKQQRFVNTLLFFTIWATLLYFAKKNLYDFSPQGRHLFPLLPIFAWLIYLGLIKIKRRSILLIYLLFSLFTSIYALWVLIDRFYVKGTGYVIASNFGNYLGDFSWRILSYSNLKRLVYYILVENPLLFTPIFVFIYFLLFLFFSLTLILYIIGAKNDQTN